MSGNDKKKTTFQTDLGPSMATATAGATPTSSKKKHVDASSFTVSDVNSSQIFKSEVSEGEDGSDSTEDSMDVLAQMVEELEARKRILQERLKASKHKVNVFGTIRAGHVTQLRQLLQDGSVSVEDRDYNLCTPLHIASYEGRGDMVSILLEFGADPTAKDGSGRTPRDFAVANRHSSVGRLLLRATQTAGSTDDLANESTMISSPLTEGLEIPRTFPTPPPEREADPLDCSTASNENAAIASRFCTIADTVSLVVCMVGLPGRGKSYISKRIARYLNWKGVPCRVFNAGDYRRQILGAEATAKAEFFDPSNEEAAQQREKMAQLACDDLIKFLCANEVAVGVLDATNTTLERRRHLIKVFDDAPKRVRVMFVESVCDDDGIILENILRAKCGNDDYKNVQDSSKVIADFRERIQQYEKVYETLTMDEDISFIKIKNVKDSIIFHQISGGVPTRIAFFLLNLHPVAYPIYVASPGETCGQVDSRICGDETLTHEGVRYLSTLERFVEERAEAQKITILHATNPSAERTVQFIRDGLMYSSSEDDSIVDGDKCEDERVEFVPLRALDDIQAGTFSGLTIDEAAVQHPKSFARIFGSSPRGSPTSPGKSAKTQSMKYTVAFPRGESARQVNVRLESALLEIMRSPNPTMIIAPRVPAQGIIAFFGDMLPESAPSVEFQRHTVVEIGVKGGKMVHDLHKRVSVGI